jgi:ribosome recycling factor
MIKELFRETQAKMSSAIEAVEHEFSTIRTGRASLGILDPVRVDAYGSQLPLKQVCTLSTPDSRTIVIQPWDKNVTPAIEKAILAANLGLTPINDGKVIRINIPPLTEERRTELVRVAKHMAEEGRVSIRNIRRHTNDEIKRMEKDHKISEDECYKALDKVQQFTDEHITKIDQVLKAKEEEIMEV